MRKLNVMLLAAGVLLASSQKPAWAVDSAGRVVSVSGNAVVRADETGKGSPRDCAKGATCPRERMNSLTLRPGDTLYEGDVINTASNGSVKMLLADRTIVDLGVSS